MTSTAWFSFVMCAWSMTNMWLMSGQKYKLAWTSSFISQFGWAYLSWASGLWGMFVYSFVMMALCVRGVRRLGVK